MRDVDAKQLAWFYSFAAPQAEKALDWANKAYAIEPNSPAAGALLAYALSINGQIEWAKPLLESFGHNQIADLVLGARCKSPRATRPVPWQRWRGQ